jgi:glycosyltransferase involved in cell wall biosynthesis
LQDADFTIVVPTFNSEHVVARCLESIFSQVGVSFEIVVVDGASRDATLDIVRRFSAPNIVIISERDKGIYDAINKGIATAKGRMIGVLGSDDIYNPGILSVVKGLTNSATGIVAGLTEIDGKLRVDEPYGAASLISGIPFGHNAMFASSDTYGKVGPYDLAYRICADAQWVHRAIRAGVPCVKTDQVFVVFGTEGTSSSNPEEIMAEAYAVIRENFPFLTTEEAKYLLYAFRKWGPVDDVKRLLSVHSESPLFVRSLAEAFPDLDRDNQSFQRVRAFARRAFWYIRKNTPDPQ